MSSAVVFVLVCCVNGKKTLHKARLTVLHAIWLHELYSVFPYGNTTQMTKNLTTHLSHNLCAVLP